MVDTITIADGIRLLDISDDCVRGWEFGDATHVRVTLPSNRRLIAEMQDSGFLFADRTLGVEVPANQVPARLDKLIRLEVKMGAVDVDAAFEVARKSFKGDARFYIDSRESQKIADAIMKRWVEAIDEAFYCKVKGALAGFLVLDELDSGNLFIKLAAVDERFRLSGAAVALYVSALKYASSNGVRIVEGRISSNNMPVMNLYSMIGGKFSNPKDVFLKEVNL